MARLREGEPYRPVATGKLRRKGFARSEDGSLIIFGLFLFILMLAAGGIGVDFMRFEAHRARLQSTLDRAVLAASSLDQPLDPQVVVLDYFAKAGLSDYITADNIVVDQTLTSRRVSASASMTMGSTLLRFSGIDSLTAPAAGAAEESATQTEVSLVLDVSGSMSWSSSSGASKISVLRDAAKTFTNIVLCNPSDPTDTATCTVEAGKVSLTIVPYSEQVLVGETLLSAFNATAEQTWSSCVTFADTDFNTTAITPTQLLNRTGHFDARSSRSRSASNWTCKTDSWRTVVPIGSDATTLRARINALQAEGFTSIDIGMKWGAALLNPAAQPVVNDLVTAGAIDAAYADRPAAWDERGVAKVIVLMTDGENTTQYYLYDAYRDGPSPVWVSDFGSYSVYRESTGMYYWPDWGIWQDAPYGTGATQLTYPELWAAKPWAWYRQFSWLGTPGSSYGSSTKNTRLQAICDAAKAENITIYTVGFEVTSSSATVMRNCASSPAHFFNVNGLDLTDAFAAIARDITKLRLVN